jgi:dTDP-4-amino-4,6-dideoxygalactose transaminase
MAGRPCDLDALGAIARSHDVVVIEDAAHALGAEYHGRKIGAISEATAFSFYATKNLTTGEGGMVTTDDDSWAELLAVYRQHGMSTDAWTRLTGADHLPSVAITAGFKYNMSDLHAAVAINNVGRIDEWQARRDAVWARYDEAFAGLPVDVPAPAEPDTVHARHLYTLMLDVERLHLGREEIRARLWQEGIGTGVHYLAVHLHPFYAEKLGHRRGDFPNAEWVSDRTLSLPLSPFLTDDDVEDVVAAVRRVLR